MPATAKLRNRMTGEERSVDSPEELRQAYRELFTNPGRDFGVYWRKRLGRLLGQRNSEDSTGSDSGL